MSVQQESRSLTDEDIDRTCAEAVGIVFSVATSSDTLSLLSLLLGMERDS